MEAQVLVVEGGDHQPVDRLVARLVVRPLAAVAEDVVAVAVVVAGHHLVSASLIEQIRADRDGQPTFYGPQEGNFA